MRAFSSASRAWSTCMPAAAPASNAFCWRARSVSAAFTSMAAFSRAPCSAARCSPASTRPRSVSVCNVSAVDCSCASFALSSGLAMVARTWPFLTLSPACTRSVTAPAAGAKSVGLNAATTRPSAWMSRTNGPRLTSSRPRRSTLTEPPVPSIWLACGRLHAPSARTAAAPATAMRRRRRGGLAMTVSCEEVSRIMKVGPGGAGGALSGFMFATSVPPHGGGDAPFESRTCDRSLARGECPRTLADTCRGH